MGDEFCSFLSLILVICQIVYVWLQWKIISIL